MAVKQSAGQGKLAIEGSLIEIYVPQLKDIFTFSFGRPGIGISLCSLIIKGMITFYNIQITYHNVYIHSQMVFDGFSCFF